MSVSLSTGLRNGVNALQDLDSVISKTNNRLQTGKKVNSAIDNAASYFSARGFDKEARDLSNLLDRQVQATENVSKALKAIDNVQKLIESAQSLAKQARVSTDTTARNNIQTQIASLLTQATNQFSDSGFNGKNLLVSERTVGAVAGALTPAVKTGATLTVATSTEATNFTSVTLDAQDVRLSEATGLNLAIAANGFKATTPGTLTASFAVQAATGAGSFEATAAGDTTIDNFVSASITALNRLQTTASSLATNAQVLELRQQFTKDSIRINKSSSDYLTLADINEEGANLTALQTRQQLAVQALSLASRSDQAILRLF
jgi:flagellin